MFKKILPHEDKQPVRYGSLQQKQSWVYVSAVLIVCISLVVWYAGFFGSTTLSENQPAALDKVSALSPANSTNSANSVNRSGAIHQKAQFDELSGPGTVQDLTLTGVISGQSSGSLALVSISGRPAQPYAKGAYIKPGYMIQTIDPDRVVLTQGIDKPALFTLLLMVKPMVSPPFTVSAASSVSDTSSVSTYHAVSTDIQKAFEAGPLPRADARYRLGSLVRHQHGHAEGVPQQ